MQVRELFNIWYDNVSDCERKELASIKDDDREINERFALPLSFGTAGMRGLVGIGTFRMNNYTVARATSGLAQFINSLKGANDKGVVISYDTRRFSLEFAKKVACVLSHAKIKSFLFENVHPVPMCSFAIRHLHAVAGVMITASHNPKEYNGYKVYGEDGAQMSIEDTDVVVKYIDAIDDYFSIKEDKVKFPQDMKGLDNYKVNDYITIIGKSVDDVYYDIVTNLSLSKDAVAKYGKQIKIVYTPIHGAGFIPVTTVFDRMGVNVHCVKAQCQPDTEFSTVPAPNPENPSALKMGIALGNRVNADVVIGTDPDCDRMGIAVRDFQGEFLILNGNQIGTLLLDYILTRLSQEGKLPKNGAVVKTIVTTTLADRICKDFGVTVFNVLTGFKFIGEKIKEWEKSNEYSFIFGYEESFGYLMGTHSRDKDAVVACMLTAEMACYYESIGKGIFERLNELFRTYGYYREEVVSIAYSGVSAMEDMAAAMRRLRARTVSQIGDNKVHYVSDYIKKTTVYADGKVEAIKLPDADAIKFGLENDQFICVRPSGTEPKLKIYVLCYSDSFKDSQLKANKLMEGIKAEL